MNINDFLGILGYSSLIIALGLCSVTILTSLITLLKKNTYLGAYLISSTAQPFAIGIAVFSLGWLLVKNVFEYTLVFNAVEKGMPWYYKLSGLWSGQASSLMFWSLILSLFIAFFVNLAIKNLHGSYAAIVALVLTAGLIFYLIPVIFITNPFERLWQLLDGTMLEAFLAPASSGLIVPVDGQGMNPSLRHPAMLMHPPTLYIGLVGFFVPFALALAGLALGDKDHSWIRKSYPVVVFSWVFLTAGMFLGSWWAYTILGWGGYWGWDAVEIAGLLPWLLSFGLIHSMQMQMRGKDFLRWIYIFSGLIVFFILSGILITRSGILESVHAYSAGVMGPVLSVLILLNMVPFVYFFFKRGMHLTHVESSDSNSIADKLANLLNVSIILLVLIYFVGQTFPLTSLLFIGQKVSWTQEIYERLSSPVLLAVMGLTALFPLADEKSGKLIGNIRLAVVLLAGSAIFPIYLLFNTPINLYGAFGFWIVGFLILAWLVKLGSEMVKKKTLVLKVFSLGMVLVHLGLGLTAWGILGSENLSRQYDISIEVGEQKEIGGFSITGQSREMKITEMRTEIYMFNILMQEPGRGQKVLTPDLEYYPKLNTLYARPAIDSNLVGDVQLILSEWESTIGSGAGVRVNVQPLISWLWIGGLVMGLGGLVILFTAGKSKKG
jgi:cytochrome c-type biogenesis protein CcmF